MLTPEKCIEIQNAIGADIIMQLDDAVKTTYFDKSRIEESVRRCIYVFIFFTNFTMNMKYVIIDFNLVIVDGLIDALLLIPDQKIKLYFPFVTALFSQIYVN